MKKINKTLFFIGALILVLSCLFFVKKYTSNETNVNSLEITENFARETDTSEIKSSLTDIPLNFLTFKNAEGLEFKYPPEWTLQNETMNQREDDNYRSLAQVLNLQRTYEPYETIDNFTVSETNTSCQEPLTVNRSNKRMADTGWVLSSGRDGDFMFRYVCVPTNSGSIEIRAEASNESVALMDIMFSSLTVNF